MARYALLGMLIFGIVGTAYFLLKPKPDPFAQVGGSKPKSEQVAQGNAPVSSASPSPMDIRVAIATMDHRFKDMLVTSEGEVIKAGSVIKEGIVAHVEGNNATVLRPDGGTTWLATDRESVTYETLYAVGTVSTLDVSGNPLQVETVMMSDGRMFRLGRDCRYGVVESIREGEIKIRRDDGGYHVVTYGSGRGLDPRISPVAMVATGTK